MPTTFLFLFSVTQLRLRHLERFFDSEFDGGRSLSHLAVQALEHKFQKKIALKFFLKENVAPMWLGSAGQKF